MKKAQSFFYLNLKEKDKQLCVPAKNALAKSGNQGNNFLNSK
jgi:hypothetical protein